MDQVATEIMPVLYHMGAAGPSCGPVFAPKGEVRGLHLGHKILTADVSALWEILDHDSVDLPMVGQRYPEALNLIPKPDVVDPINLLVTLFITLGMNFEEQGYRHLGYK